jgi:hypothetical protein
VGGRGPVFPHARPLLERRRDRAVPARGRQYLREISGNGTDFGFPRGFGGELCSVVPWSRLFVDDEVLLAINTDPDRPSTAWVTIDDAVHTTGSTLACRYATDPAQIGDTLTVESRNGKAVRLTVPPAGLVVLV